MRFFILTSLLLLIALSSLSAQGLYLDTIPYPDVRYGVGCDYRKISSNTSEQGYGLSFYIEKRIMQRATLNSGLFFQYGESSFGRLYIEKINNGDTSNISHYYGIKRHDTELVIPLTVKFYYLNKPLLYLMLGLESSFILKEKIDRTYSVSRFTNEDGERIDIYESIASVPTSADERPFISLGMLGGLGIGWGKFNIETVWRGRAYIKMDSFHEWVLRLKYQLGHRHKKAKQK